MRSIFVALSVALFSLPAFSAEIEAVRLDNGFTTIVVRGEILPEDGSKFFDVAQRAERATAFLESPSGNVQAALEIGTEIAIWDFATLVLDGEDCFSACALGKVPPQDADVGATRPNACTAAFFRVALTAA